MFEDWGLAWAVHSKVLGPAFRALRLRELNWGWLITLSIFAGFSVKVLGNYLFSTSLIGLCGLSIAVVPSLVHL